MKNLKANQHPLFVLCADGLEVVNRGGTVFLSEAYVDHEAQVQDSAGKVVKYIKSRDYQGKETPMRFMFNESLRRLQVREHDHDFNGISQYKWLKNYPTCEGSPYGTYEEVDGVVVQRGVQFREMNTAKDAEIALVADKLRIKAQADVLNIDKVTLSEIAAVLGVFGDPDEIMQLRVLEFAGKRPTDYFELREAGDRAVKAIVRTALNSGVFKQKGTAIYWEQTLVGSDENTAVSKLLGDQSMIDALQEKLGLKADVKADKKPRGNPNFGKNKE